MSSTPQKLPRHIAIIMDGNGRWAKQRHLPRIAGHAAGRAVVRKVIEWCVKKEINVLTLFAFSSENWRRPKEEVNFLFELFTHVLEVELKFLQEQHIRVRVIGDTAGFPEILREKISQAEKTTAENKGLTLVIAADYGGQWDIVQATKKIAAEVSRRQLTLSEITPERFQSYLSCADLPLPDLFIRTSGEQRISNFLLWQLAYTELFFTEVLWPDFDETIFNQALAFFTSRQRRFGYTGEQVEQQVHV